MKRRRHVFLPSIFRRAGVFPGRRYLIFWKLTMRLHKAARKAKGISRNQLADTLNIAPRYIASIENSGQHPSLQILYELVTLLDVSVDQFFFPEREQEKSTRRRQLDTMLDTMSETDLKIMSATAKGIEEANNDRTGE